jgi:hypothetical protein
LEEKFAPLEISKTTIKIPKKSSPNVPCETFPVSRPSRRYGSDAQSRLVRVASGR